jgi:hypothetical protein
MRGQSLANPAPKKKKEKKRQNTLFHPEVESFPAFSSGHKPLREQKVPNSLASL